MTKYADEVVAFFTHDGLILCPFCVQKEATKVSISLAERRQKNVDGIYGLTRSILSEFMQARFQDADQFYEETEFYPCDMCGGEIE